MTGQASPTTLDYSTLFPDEVVTHAHVRQVDVPSGTATVRMALITLDNGLDHNRPNTFGPTSLLELDRALDEAFALDGVAAVAVTGKPFILSAGADLSGVPAITDRATALEIGRLGHRVFRRLGDTSLPTFCFINGLAIGGGVEIGLHCDYRTVISSLPALGLSECYLGLVPGWGGAWLLPNLVGADAAVTVIVENPLNNNKLLRVPEVMALGLADAMFDGADFLAQSLRWAASVVTGAAVIERAQPDRGAAWDAALARGRAVADAKTGGAAPAPYRALALIDAARATGRDEGFAAEDEALADLLMTDEMRAGVYTLDLVTKRAKRPAGAPRATLARPVTKVGIVGAGLMASQIGLLLARRLQVPVVLTDVDQARVDHGVAAVHAEIATLARKGRLRPDAANRLTALVTGAGPGPAFEDAFADADLVIEAVFEQLDVKTAVFAQLEAVVRPDCVLATNTSSLSVSAMAAGLAHPERVVGLHFFNPVAVMPFLEVVRAEATDDASLATAFAVAKELKKTAVLVKDSPAFVVNRLLGRWMGEVSRIVDEGTPLPVAERAFAGLAPMPPFMLLGLVGPAIALHTAVTLHAAFPDRFYVSPSLRRLVEAGKTAIYSVVDGRPAVDPEVAALFEKPAQPVELTRDQVREQVLAALAEEARIMLDEGVVVEPADIDLGLITGAGFSPWNGGLTPLLDRTGIAEKVTGARFLPAGVASVAPGH